MQRVAVTDALDAAGDAQMQGHFHDRILPFREPRESPSSPW
jgi:hypothetical protein